MEHYIMIRPKRVEAYEINEQGELQSKVIIDEQHQRKMPGKFIDKKPGKNLKKAKWDREKNDWVEGGN